MKRGIWLALIVIGSALFLTAQPTDSAFGQEGTITPLSMGGDKISLLHQSHPDSVKDFLSRSPNGSNLGSLAGDHNIERALSVYTGDLVADGDHLELLADLNAAGHHLAGLSRDALVLGQAKLVSALTTVAGFPHLASNLVVENGPLGVLTRAFTATDLDALRSEPHSGGIYDGMLIDADGVSVCVFGLIDPSSSEAELELPKGIEISDPVLAALRMVNVCEASDADLIVSVISLNSQHRLDNQIKEAVAGIDVFILGGSPTQLDPNNDMPISVVRTEKGSSISVKDEGLGRLDLTFTANPLTLLYEFNPSFLSIRSGSDASAQTDLAGIGLLMLGMALAGVVIVAGLFVLRGN